MIPVTVKGITLDTNNNPVLLLEEINGRRILPIWIGPVEATAISYALQKQKTQRPLTLDLIKRIIEGLGAKVIKVVITQIKDNTYYANMILEIDSKIVLIDARPSDSVAVAIHTNAPIYVSEEVMNSQSQVLDFPEKDETDELKKRIQNIDPENFGDYEL